MRKREREKGRENEREREREREREERGTQTDRQTHRLIIVALLNFNVPSNGLGSLQERERGRQTDRDVSEDDSGVSDYEAASGQRHQFISSLTNTDLHVTVNSLSLPQSSSPGTREKC